MRLRSSAAVALVCALTVASISACSLDDDTPAPATSEASPTSEPPPPPPQPSPTAEERVPQDLRAKVASLMVVGVSNYDQARFALDQGAGGLIIPSWADPGLLTDEGRNINALRAEYDRPFSVTIDFEGGRVQRHSGVLGDFMPPRVLAGMPPEVIQGTGYDIGVSLRAHGINVDYAPLLDLDVTNLDIVGDRSFHGAPDEVVRIGGLFSQGLFDAGVTPTFKHFPGHGRASGDTHHQLAITPPLEDVRGLDMVPYGPLLERFPHASVMMGHMIVPGMGEDGVPSSLNPEAYRVLREGDYPGGVPFNGVVVTDDLSGMRGLLDYTPTPEAVKRAIAAGADQALWSSGADLPYIIDLVTGAVMSGEIPMARVDEAATRVQQQLIDGGL
ncbi:glycoside hydrolase family 3 N-terminal domain-containing protein [Corynebacterium glaucum]|uniref:glycoside hydrolase family 3 N-terminal domain-containing protein n=1 Tax=Corynebacterium glaucum TaxID=187491 RepID=UPI0025B4ADD4|nr:glycoside hydrolase family 3 N-terminal domain-containing protein [Corynebacterium glaucum]